MLPSGMPLTDLPTASAWMFTTLHGLSYHPNRFGLRPHSRIVDATTGIHHWARCDRRMAVRRSRATSTLRVGFLPLDSPDNAYDRSLVELFRHRLRDVGVVEDRDMVLNIVFADHVLE